LDLDGTKESDPTTTFGSFGDEYVLLGEYVVFDVFSFSLYENLFE